MKSKILLLTLIALIFTACKSREGKINELIKADLYKRLYDFSSYEPIETFIDSAFTSIYRDSIILKNAYDVRMHLDNANEYIDKVKEARSLMEIWDGIPSSYAIEEYNAAKIKFETYFEESNLLMKQVDELMAVLKEDINNFEPSFCGFQAEHKFRCKTMAGNFTIGEYMYIVDEKLEKVLYSYDLDDESLMKIRKLIDEVKEFEIEKN